MTTFSYELEITNTSREDAVQILGTQDGDIIELNVFDEPEETPLMNLYAYIPAGTVLGEKRIVRLISFPRTDNAYGVRLVSDCWFDCGISYTGDRVVFNRAGGTAFLTWSGMSWLCQCTLVDGEGNIAMLFDTNETNRSA